MKMLAVLVASSFLLAGCVTLEEPVFGRVDCQLVGGNDAVSTQFTLDRQICLGQANASAARRSGGVVGEVRDGIMTACMGQRGYIYAYRREHVRRCGHDDAGRSVLVAPRPAAPLDTPAAAPASAPRAPAGPPAAAAATAPAQRPQPTPAQAAEEARCRALADEGQRLRCFVDVQQRRLP